MNRRLRVMTVATLNLIAIALMVIVIWGVSEPLGQAFQTLYVFLAALNGFALASSIHNDE